jgi:hypothetical protein
MVTGPGPRTVSCDHKSMTSGAFVNVLSVGGAGLCLSGACHCG